MIWILITAGIIVLLIVLGKIGNNKFWQTASKNPEKAYEFFTQNDCWYVIYPGEEKAKPSGDWDGPFFFLSGNVNLKIYGKLGEYEKKQDEFVKSINKHK